MTTRREEIINAFIKVSNRKGLDNTTMQDIAQKVGISVGTIYLDFKNKEEIIDAFGKRVFQQIDHAVERILQLPVPAEAKLYELLVGDVKFFSEHIRKDQSLFEFFHHDNIKHIHKDLKEKRMEFEKRRVDIIRRILEQGMEEGHFIVANPEQAARLFFFAFGSHHFRGPMVLEREHREVVGDAEALFDLLLQSIKREMAHD